MPSSLRAVLAVSALLLIVRPAAAADPDATCYRGMYAAATKYNACQQKVMTKIFGGVDPGETKIQAAFSKCRVKYVATWDKLSAKAAGTGAHCDNQRFDVGPATTKDRLTKLDWERKTDDDTIHDRDNQYTWGSDADGPVFDDFLATLNAGCFAGHCDWRLPTIYELQTILASAYPCAVDPCIDVSVFGPTYAFYWTDTANVQNGDPWTVKFYTGGIVYYSANNATLFARAVRGGL